MLEARRRGLRVLPRSAGLAAVMAGRRVLAVAGTHGKTTTTGLLTSALLAAGADPTYAVGGVLTATGRNADAGSDDLFVAEADESDGAFLVYRPHAAIVTNVEADHLDNWGTEEAYHAAFDEFAGTIDRDGFLVVVGDDAGAAALATYARSDGLEVITVGEGESCDLRLVDVAFEGSTSRGRVLRDGVVRRRPGAPHPRTPLPPRRPGRARRRSPPRARRRRPAGRAGRLHRDGPADGAEGRGVRGARLRLLRPPPRRDRRRPPGRPGRGRRRPHRRRLPAAPRLPHPDLRGADGRRARCRRRGRRPRRLPRARGRRPRR